MVDEESTNYTEREEVRAVLGAQKKGHFTQSGRSFWSLPTSLLSPFQFIFHTEPAMEASGRSLPWQRAFIRATTTI